MRDIGGVSMLPSGAMHAWRTPQPELCAFLVEMGLRFGFDTWAHGPVPIRLNLGLTAGALHA